MRKHTCANCGEEFEDSNQATFQLEYEEVFSFCSRDCMNEFKTEEHYERANQEDFGEGADTFDYAEDTYEDVPL